MSVTATSRPSGTATSRREVRDTPDDVSGGTGGAHTLSKSCAPRWKSPGDWNSLAGRQGWLRLRGPDSR
jgi:hypothetical protein